MKKKSIMRILTGTLCLAMLMSGAAFAAEDTGLAGSVPATKLEAAQKVMQYGMKDGTITAVDEKDGTYTITVDDGKGGVIFHAKGDSFVFDQKAGKVVSIKELKKDMKLGVVVSANTPMTMSLPPQISGASAYIIKSDAAAVAVSLFNDELTDADNSLKLNIAEDTQILDTKGSKIKYTAEDVKGRNCIVMYSTSTRSIPAQTTPQTIILLEKVEDGEAEAAAQGAEAANTKEAKADEYVELRSAVEAKGYKVEWSSSKKPIVLTKNDMTIEVTIGSTEFSFTHMTRDLKELDRMEKLSMPVKLENGKTMVAKSFIDAME